MSETGVIRGFKVFNPDWTCRDKQYTCPGAFEEDVIPSVCDRGIHFCKRAAECFNYYSFSPENKVAEVVAYADRTVEDGDKSECGSIWWRGLNDYENPLSMQYRTLTRKSSKKSPGLMLIWNKKGGSRYERIQEL